MPGLPECLSAANPLTICFPEGPHGRVSLQGRDRDDRLLRMPSNSPPASDEEEDTALLSGRTASSAARPGAAGATPT